MTLNPDQFSIEAQGPTPLRYHRYGDIQRLGAVHPDAAAPEQVTRRLTKPKDVPDTEYWSPRVEVHRGDSGKPLKKPKVIDNPSAAAPGTAAFIDYEDRGHEVFVHYGTTRPDMKQQGLGGRLVQEVADRHPGKLINFGQVVSPHMWRLKERLEGQGRQTAGWRDF